MHNPTNSRTSSPVAVAVVAILILPMFYILSPGPVFWLLTQTGIEENELAGTCVSVLYAPLIWLYEKFPFVQGAYDWYFSLFGMP